MFTRAIVRPPAPNFSEGLTTAELGAPDYKQALRQHQAYCAALEQCGLTLRRQKPDSDHPDSTFVEDAAVLTRECAVLTRPGAVSRRAEVPGITSVLEEFFPASQIQTIHAPGTLDGGDVCEADQHFFIGVSERTNESGARQLAEILARFGYTASFVEIRSDEVEEQPLRQAGLTRHSLLHLKSGIAYLGENRLVVTEELAGRGEFTGYDLLPVSSHEAYAANCVRVNDHMLVAAGFPAFESRLKELGYRTIALEMSEFQKMDGGLSCLSLRF